MKLTKQQQARRKDFAKYLRTHLAQVPERFSYFTFCADNKSHRETPYLDAIETLAEPVASECGTYGCIAGHYCAKYSQEFTKDKKGNVVSIHDKKSRLVPLPLLTVIGQAMGRDMGLLEMMVERLIVPDGYQDLPTRRTEQHRQLTQGVVEHIAEFLEGARALTDRWLLDLCAKLKIPCQPLYI